MSATALGDQTYADLRRKIIQCEIEPGASVTQLGLMDLVGPNRGALRSALIRLSQEGLIRSVPRHGYRVSELTVKGAKDIMQVRIMLEGPAAALAAGRISEASLNRVREGFAGGYDRHDPSTISRYLATNRLFKISIAEATGNAALVQHITGLVDQFERYLRLGHQKVDRHKEMFEGAELLIDLLQRGEAEAARRETERHLAATRDLIVKLLISSEKRQASAVKGRRLAA